MPKISIVIPLYNKETAIERTIQSVLCQEYHDFELIVVNDGSTDHSLDVVKGISDERIRIINQQNSGVSAARNRGMNEANGEYVLFLDADDNLLENALNLISCADGYDVVFGSFVQTDSRGEIVSRSLNSRVGEIKDVFRSYWNREFYVRMGNFMVNRQFLNRVVPFRTDLSLYEDLEWLMRLIVNAKVYVSNQIILDYKRGETGLSRGYKPIEKDFAKMASVKNVSNKYQRKVIGDFIFRRFYGRVKTRDWHGAKVIWSNNAGWMLYCFMSCLGRYVKSKTNRIMTKTVVREENVLPGLSDTQLQIRKFVNNLRSRYMLDIRYKYVCWGGVNLSYGYPSVPVFSPLTRM